MYITWHSLQGRFNSSLHYFFTRLLCQCGHADIGNTLWVIVQCHVFYFAAQMYQHWPLGALSVGSCVPLFFLPNTAYFLILQVAIGSSLCSRLQPQDQPLLQAVPLLENGIRIQDLGTGFATGTLTVGFKSSASYI